jgi:hypothetical protein
MSPTTTLRSYFFPHSGKKYDTMRRGRPDAASMSHLYPLCGDKYDRKGLAR